MGHKASRGGGLCGGCQGIMFVPDPEGGPAMSTCRGNDHGRNDRDDRDDGRVNGFYRAGSNFREDGDSIGW